MDRDPLFQAEAQACWLSNFLAEGQFKAFVQPVVVFPGLFIEPFDMKAAKVWVFEPKSPDRFIDHLRVRLSKDEVKAMASALSSTCAAKMTCDAHREGRALSAERKIEPMGRFCRSFFA